MNRSLCKLPISPIRNYVVKKLIIARVSGGKSPNTIVLNSSMLLKHTLFVLCVLLIDYKYHISISLLDITSY